VIFIIYSDLAVASIQQGSKGALKSQNPSKI